MSRAVTAVALTLALVAAAPASAQSPYPPGPFAPWDGTNPFNCFLQNVGTGTNFPDPGADPFCVEFDKNSQSVAPNFGILDFLINEPARVAAASPKCFYFQTDHWTGAAVQGQPPELWHWDGQYFFDKAFAVGGVNVRNFRVGGQPASPSDYGQVPLAFAPYMDQGGGGAYIVGNIPAEPRCVARVDTQAERDQIYANGRPPPLPPGAYQLRCAQHNTVYGSISDDELVGGPFGDRLYGYTGNDKLFGDSGDDCLFGLKGKDRAIGGPGRDRVKGGRGDDFVKGSRGKDRLRGGPGDDVIRARDRKRDLVRCGPGHDTARVDAADNVRGCEETTA